MKLQIKKIKSPTSNKSSQKNKKYQNFLENKVDQKEVKKSKDKRVIQMKRKINSPKKKKKVIQDINEIEQKMNQMKTDQMNIQMPTQNKSLESQPKVQPKVHKAQPKPKQKLRVTGLHFVEPKVQDPSKVKSRPLRKPPMGSQPGRFLNKDGKVYSDIAKEIQGDKPKVETKIKPKVSRTRRSNRRSTQRKKSKIHGRKVSVKSRIFNKKDIQRVEDKIKEIRGKKTDEIKSELKEQGIKVSGKSNRLLKDIYLYSKMCNINIQHEK